MDAWMTNSGCDVDKNDEKRRKCKEKFYLF